MKTNKLLITMLCMMVVVSQSAPVWAQSNSKSLFKQGTAAAPQSRKDFKEAAENLQTRFGMLNFPGGYPTEETSQKVYDELDLQRATQLYL
ncbi:DUF1254 domain-containing protein, partial [Candidatus Omnitrophota bacterium]